ncbi:MAG: hypothetical protein ABI140_17775 [Jatrophihabitantaceae bacterium]
MAIPTDRGYVILSKASDGKLTVSVSTSAPIAGKSSDVFAQHVGESAVHIDPAVSLVERGALSWTTRPVRVFVGQGGLVNIAPPRASALGD